MKRYQLWKSDFLFWIQLLWTPSSLFRWKRHNLMQTQMLPIPCKSTQWWGWIVAGLKALASSHSPAWPPRLTKACSLARSSLVVLLDSLWFITEPKQGRPNRAKRGIDMMHCKGVHCSAKFSLYRDFISEPLNQDMWSEKSALSPTRLSNEPRTWFHSAPHPTLPHSSSFSKMWGSCGFQLES